MGGVLVTLLQWQNEYTQCPHPTRRRARDAHAQQQAATLPLPRCVAEAVMHATYCTRHTTQHGDAAADAHAAAATAAATTTTTTAVGTRVQWMHDAGHYGAPYTLPGDDRGDGQGTASAQRAMSRTAAASELRDSTQAHNDNNNSDGHDAVGGDDKDDDDETAALLMGTMDCVDAYAYLRSAKPSAHADEESAVYAAADTATQLIAHWHRRRGAHSSSSNNASTTRAHDANDDDATDDGVPPPLLLLSRGVSSDAFVSLVSTLRRCCCCCRPHASELAVSWRSVLDTSLATPATRTQQQQKQRATTNTAVPAATVATAATGAATRRRMWCADMVYYLGPRQYMTYGELWSRVRALSCALRALRVRPGDMLLLLDDTRVEWLVTCYAAWWCGMVVVVLHDSPQCLARAAHDVACDRVRVVVCKHTALRALRRQMTRARRHVCSSGNNNGSSDDEASVTSHTAAATISTDDDSDVHCRSVAWRLLASRRRPVYIATRTLLTSSNSDSDNNKDSEDEDDEDVLRWCEVVEHGEAVHARVRRDTSASSPSSSWSSSPVELRASDLAMIAYTEGEAKGVMLTHGALAASLAAYCANIADMQLWQRSDSDSHGEDSVDEDKDDECAADKHSIAHGRRRGGCVTDAYGEHDTTVSAAAAADDDNNNGDNTTRPRYLAYMPMHTVREVMLQTASLLHGVLVCYGAAATLYDHAARPRGDLAEYKPHLLTATPATLDALCARVQHSLSHGYRRLLFDAGVAARQRALHRGLDTPLLHRVLFAQPRSLLGGCCRVVLATAAPLQPRTRRYVEVVCGVSVRQLYSCVEAAGCGLLQHSGSALHHHNASDAGGDEDDEDEDNVGVPHASLVLKLRDVSRRWRHSDVLPAGELLVCGPAVMCGYYRQPERTAEVLERVRCRCRLRHRRHRSNDDGSSASSDDNNNEGNGVRTRRGRHHSSSVCGCTAQQHQHGSGGDCVCGSHSSNSMDSMHTNKDDDSSSTSSSSSSSEEDDDEQQPQHAATRSTYCTGWWLHTGSIAQRTREGTLRIVDCMSASNVTNACGRRLSLEQLEDMYSRHALCLRAGVCVLVHPFRDYVCALVLTDEARARAFVHSVQQQQQRVVHGTTSTTRAATADNDDNSSTRRLRMTWPYCLREAGFNRAAAAALAAHAAQHRAAAHERVRAVRVLYDEWSVYNGLRTTTGRLRRDRIAAKYADVIAELFAQPSSRS